VIEIFESPNMTFEIKVGPPHLTLHHGYAVAVSERDGQIHTGGEKGLYFLDTRLISQWEITANEQPWILLDGANLEAIASRVYLTNAQLPSHGNFIPEKTLGLVLSRHLDGGMHEDLDITNYGSETAHFALQLAINGDFADFFEVKGKTVTQRGEVLTEWHADEQALTTRYHNKDFSRAFKVSASCPHSPMHFANGRIGFTIALPPRANWHACLLYDLADADCWSKAPPMCFDDYEASDAAKARKHWQEHVLKVDTADVAFRDSFAQALRDVAALRLPIEGTDEVKFVPAAGLPWFVALFGRDSLVISLQTAIVHPEFALGALRVLAKWQATERDDYRDAEPGKIHHELRRGELAHFKLIPHTPYYGTADATPLYLITLHSMWMGSGDRAILAEHLGTAERCLDWIDRFGDRDADGFQEYQTRSPVGYENQSWKDSGGAIIYPDGSCVKGPKALCELQGYVYDAWLRMAQIYDALDRHERATELRTKAASLFERFNATFWNEAEGFYALALDGDKKQVVSIASNPGQCLWSGIVPSDRARRVADRLMQPDMWCGWGIRTLSAAHGSFNPYHYQIGAVWPHDNGFIAQGMKRYGLCQHAFRVVEAITHASSFFNKDQIPELYAGTTRTPSSFPVQYLGANVPQGWAAGSMFSLLQALLGFQPDAPHEMLYLDPDLPEWLPELTVRDLKMGQRSFDIRFTRAGADTEFEVLRGPKGAVARRAMEEWARLLRGESTPGADSSAATG
jgi:glycogen debranching enzyme